MKTLENSQDKIEKICDTLRKETIEPAKIEANRIIEEARQHAEKILQEARQEHKAILSNAEKEIEQQRKVFSHRLFKQLNKVLNL